MQNQTCYLISYVKFGDNDAFLHCFSAEFGYQSFVAKGLYSSKNKKKPYLQPLNLLNISVVNKGNKVSTISKLELAEQRLECYEVKEHSLLFFGAEFLNQVLRNEDRHELAFRAIQDFLQNIQERNYSAHILLMLNFLAIAGIAPLSGDGKYLDPDSGTFTNEKTHPLFTEKLSSVWKGFLARSSDSQILLKREERNNFLDSVLLYYHRHFSGFYTPNSLAVLRQIFD